MEKSRCQECRVEIETGRETSHLVRMGYSLAQFPLLSYKRMVLCPECLGKHKRKDKWEKVVAVALLSVVCFLLGLGYLMLFKLI